MVYKSENYLVFKAITPIHFWKNGKTKDLNNIFKLNIYAVPSTGKITIPNMRKHKELSIIS